MPKLTDTQLVILTAAAKRDDGVVLPLPKSLKLQGGAATAPLKSLLKKRLVAERPAKADEDVWREDDDGQRLALIITDTGLAAIGVEPNEEAAASAVQPQPKPKKPRRAAVKKTVAVSAPQATPPAVRSGTKQALLIDLLRREEGATIADVMAVTGWQAHSVRGAISGALKKKLGLTITSQTIDGRGRVYHIPQTA